MLKYKVTLNWYNELHHFEIIASSKAQTRYFAIKKLSHKLSRNTSHHFVGRKDKSTITEIKKD